MKLRPRYKARGTVSSTFHPVYTGEQHQAKAEGRVAQFSKRFGKRGLKSLEKV